MRNGQGFHARGPPFVHLTPQVFRVFRHAGSIGQGRDLGGAEDHVAVQVAVAGRGGDLVADQGGEVAGVIVAGRRFLDLAPGGKNLREKKF